MGYKFDFEGLFVCDMANNHQGSVEHGLRIVDQIGEVTRAGGVRGALKFQFRHMDTFIHPDFRDRKDVKHIPRFLETRLSNEEYAELAVCVRKNELVTMATPFDEESLGLIEKLDIQIVKVASCSATDWPLLDEISGMRRPVILSTAGLSISEIDRAVNLFTDHHTELALMHCVGIYPTPGDKLLLNQISTLKKRYPDITIGFSTHEDPENLDAVRIAYALGARLFERHVDVEDDGFSMNSYSSTPRRIERWIAAYLEAVASCGPENRPPSDLCEAASLRSLKRGVYARRDLREGAKIERRDVFFAMPFQDGQLSSGEFLCGKPADREYKKNQPISAELALHEPTDEEITDGIMLQVRGMLNEARIHVGKDFTIEISHHYGLKRFREYGAVIIDCINRDYCKKLIVQLPRQKHPYHHHLKKEETFLVLHGNAEIEINGHRKEYAPGEMITVHPGEWHKFQTANGVIFEEVSTTHYDNDSTYEDQTIARKKRRERKTVVPNWASPA